jgi:superfamily II DNA or RNA helicase
MTGSTSRPSRALRELVFAKGGGLCQRQGCGAEITLETFHLAHVRARANGGPAIEPNLEAWCRRCNLTWGARDAGDPRLTPREWQLAALDQIVASIIRSGAATVSAAPGAGKTVFAGLVFEVLRELDVVDRMVAFVPRRGLVDQWVGALAATRHLELKPHSAIERPEQAGAVVTYQSLGNRDALHAHQIQAERRRTLLVFDEVHHVGQPQGGQLPAWARNVSALAGDVETHNIGVAGILNLSGTLWRSARNERISTVRYRPVDDNRLESLVDFDVSVAELVGRGELRPVDLYRQGVQVRLADYQNLEHVEGDLSDLDEQPARAAMASLSSIGEWRTAFVSSVLDRLEAAHRALDGYHAKALIVAGRQEAARAFYDEVDRQMRERGLPPLAALAISDEQDAQRTLDDFRDQKRSGVLCTVDMAGEGYDCPDIAVIGYASNKLTSLFVRQVTARAMRVTDRERELERVIPAAVVLPDAQALVEQLVSYLAPFTHEVLVATEEELARRHSDGTGNRDETPFLPMPRYGLESARPDASGMVTVPYADGSQEDVDATLASRLAIELERANVAGIYAPRVIAATRRTVGDLLASRPFDRPGADTAVMERLANGAQAVAEADIRRTSTIEERAAMLMDQLDKWARWWQVNGDSPASHFNRMVNEAADIRDGNRPSASVDKLLRARNYARGLISNHCRGSNVKPPRGLEAR